MEIIEFLQKKGPLPDGTTDGALQAIVETNACRGHVVRSLFWDRGRFPEFGAACRTVSWVQRTGQYVSDAWRFKRVQVVKQECPRLRSYDQEQQPCGKPDD